MWVEDALDRRRGCARRRKCKGTAAGQCCGDVLARQQLVLGRCGACQVYMLGSLPGCGASLPARRRRTRLLPRTGLLAPAAVLPSSSAAGCFAPALGEAARLRPPPWLLPLGCDSSAAAAACGSAQTAAGGCWFKPSRLLACRCLLPKSGMQQGISARVPCKDPPAPPYLKALRLLRSTCAPLQRQLLQRLVPPRVGHPHHSHHAVAALPAPLNQQFQLLQPRIAAGEKSGNRAGAVAAPALPPGGVAERCLAQCQVALAELRHIAACSRQLPAAQQQAVVISWCDAKRGQWIGMAYWAAMQFCSSSCRQAGRAGLTQQLGPARNQLPSRPSAAFQHLLQLGQLPGDGIVAEAEALRGVQEPLQSRLLVQAAQLLQEPQPCRDVIGGPACG